MDKKVQWGDARNEKGCLSGGLVCFVGALVVAVIIGETRAQASREEFRQSAIFDRPSASESRWNRYVAWNGFSDSPILAGSIYGVLVKGITCDYSIYGGILDSTPAICKPSVNPIQPYDVVRFERSVNVIQRAWRESLYNPVYRICRQRLMVEFEEMLAVP